MTDVICPLDGKPCEKDCPDRFVDTPDGGCLLTMSLEIGAHVMYIDGGRLYDLTEHGPEC